MRVLTGASDPGVLQARWSCR